MRKIKTIRFLPVILCVIGLIVAAGIVFAAFAISGYRKGVAVSNSYYFRSNVLTDIDDSGNAENKVYTTVETELMTTVGVNIMNYYNGQINGFDVDYMIYYKLVGGTAGTYTYSINYRDSSNTVQTVTLSPSDDFIQLGGTFTLSAEESAGDKDTFNVVFNKPDNTYQPSQAASIVLYAVPTSPEYMRSFMIGGRIKLSASDAEFGVSGEFDTRIDDSTINSMAGFMYYISTFGKIGEGESPQIKITWDASQLEFDEKSVYSAQVVISKDGDGKPLSGMSGSLTLSVGTGEYIPIAFYRRNGLAVTSVSLHSLVNVEQITAP